MVEDNWLRDDEIAETIEKSSEICSLEMIVNCSLLKMLIWRARNEGLHLAFYIVLKVFTTCND